MWGRSVRVLLLLGLALAGCDDIDELTGERCEENADCDDGVFCNGSEICVGNVCATVTVDPCDDGIECTIDTCDEFERVCDNDPADADGDGVSTATCLGGDGLPLGRDCDDDDPNRYPGNLEVCDADHHDEDCDPETFGSEDADQDGFFDAGCCNEDADGELLCGSDCDDSLYSIRPGSQVCDGQVEGGVLVCDPDGQWRAEMCSAESPNALCVTQPNGEGVCL